MKCRELIEILEELAPVSLACDWDNPGLLAGRSDKEVRTVYLALDATDDVIDNAVECRADMIITHHPLIFKPLKKVNDEDFISRRILKMIQNDISYYAMHTNFDAAPGCICLLYTSDARPAQMDVRECIPERNRQSGGGQGAAHDCHAL